MSYQLGIAILYFKDLPQAKRFYTDTLGMPAVEQASDEHFVLIGLAGDALLGLEDAARLPAGKTAHADGFEIGLTVADVDTTFRQWKAKGVTIQKEPSEEAFGRAFEALDAEGHLLTVYQPRPR